ncbi:cell-cycle control medial ring component [Aspergillus filifer]
MTELAFAKTFLSALDARPIKLRADAIQDQGQTPRAPYTLPRNLPSRPSMAKKSRLETTTNANPGSAKSISITLKSARNPVLEFTLPNAPISTTSVADLKDAVRERIVETGSNNKVSTEKIKILFKRKPVSGNAKTVSEVVSDAGGEGLLSGGGSVEFGVMVMGGARVADASEKSQEGANAERKVSEVGETTAKAAVGLSGEDVLQTEQFWEDLQGYLEQRLKDEEVAKRMRGLFKGAWEGNQ